MKKLLLGVLLATSTMLFAQNSNELYGLTDQSIVRIIDTADASSTIDYDSKNQLGLSNASGLTYVSSRDMFYGLEYVQSDSINLFSYNTCSGATIIATVTYNGTPIKHAEALAYNANMDSVYISYNAGDHAFASDQLGILDLESGSINFVGTFSGVGQASTNPDMDGMTFANDTLYGVDAGNNKPSHLYKIDYSTASTVTIGILSQSNVGTLAYEKNSDQLYGYSASNQELFIIDTADASTTTVGISAKYTAISFGTKNHELEGEIFALSDDAVLALDPTTAATTVLGSNLNIGSYGGLAYNQSELFYIDRNSAAPILMMIDTCVAIHEVGELTFAPGSNLIAPVGSSEGLSYNTYDNNLYVALGDKSSSLYQSEHLCTIDQQTAVVTYVSSITGTLDNEADDIAFADDQLYVLDGTGNKSGRIYNTALETGVATYNGDSQKLGFNSIAFDFNNGEMFGLISATKTLVKVDTSNAGITTIGVLTGNHTGVVEIATNSPGFYKPAITALSNGSEKSSAIYPNPTSSSFVINSDVVVSNVAITSLSGVTQNNVTLSNNTVDVSNLANGIYFVTFKENEQLISQKISIQK